MLRREKLPATVHWSGGSAILMDSISKEMPEDSTELDPAFVPAVVAHLSTLNEAQIVVSLLGSFGIAATIDSENYHRMLGSMISTMGGVPVEVAERDRAAALEVLAGSPEPAVREASEEEASR